MLVLRQPLQGGRDGLGDRVGRVGDPSQMGRQAVEEVGGRVDGRREKQRVGAGEIPVDGLPGDAQRAGDVGDGEVGAALSMAWPAAARIRAIASSSVAGADPDQPWVRTPESYCS